MTLRHATLHQLKIFTVLVRHLNMTRAAEELHMTPAALSIQIKQLSLAVGAPLHEQIGKRLFLTSTGRLVDAASRDVFKRLESLATELAAAQGMERGTLKLSVVTTAKYFAPPSPGRVLQGTSRHRRHLGGDQSRSHPGAPKTES